jgi:translocation and assembly module TamA
MPQHHLSHIFAGLVKQALALLLCLLLPQQAIALQVQVDITGLESAQADNVRAFLSIEREKNRQLTESRLRLLHAGAGDEIRKALQPFGYFKPRIEASLEALETGFRASYQINPGPRIRLGKVDIQILGDGAKNPKLKMPFLLKTGDLLDQTAYESAKKQWLSRAIESGYLNAQYTEHTLQVNLDNDQANIQLHLDTGGHFRFGSVSFRQDILDETFLRRYLTFKPGDPFNQQKLLTLQSELTRTEYFSRVEIRILRDQANHQQVPIEIELTPNKANLYRFGLGASTDTGPRATLDWKRRRVGRGGEHMRSELRLSAPHSALTTEYIQPLARPSSDSLVYGANFAHYDTDTRRGDSALVGINHHANLDNRWRRTIGLDYSYEDFSISSQNDAAYLLIPHARWTYLKSDGKAFIRQGHRFEISLEGAAQPLLSSLSYAQLRLKNKYILSLNENWRLLTRADLGITLSDKLTDLPASKRFFAGGDNSVRGFGLDDLGSKDEQDTLVGGRMLAVGSLELERQLAGKWSAAVFMDAGNAFDPDYDADIEYGAGIGVRWRSPVGPVRIDIANGLSADETQLRLHLVLGLDL